MFQIVSSTRIKFAVAILVFTGAAESVCAIDISVGPPQTIYTTSQRRAGGAAWPDGSIGVISNGNGTYDFYAANSSKITLTTGTLGNPAGSKKKVSITGVPKRAFTYLAGGPVFEDPYSGARLMMYHAEIGGAGQSFYSMLGMAVSTDPNGQVFRDLGIVIKPNRASGQAEVGGGSFAVRNGYLNVYYTDFLTDGSRVSVAVARAPMAELMTNALLGRSTTFNKYYNGNWSESGIHGKASPLEIGNPPNVWLGVSHNDYLNQLVMVSTQWSTDGGDLYFTSSPDGINWSPRQPVALDPGEQYYPTVIGTGSNPMHSGQSFYVYYTDSQKGAFSRWSDAQLRRREITINGPPLATGASNVANSLGYTGEWVPVGNYQDEFQSGAPADGWRYAWNPKGKAGRSADYAPLRWSDAIQAYNTTGSATPTPNPKTHPDDFLALTSLGGHPGRSKYMPIAGYTVRDDDGEGFYRLADTSIQLAAAQTAAKDDSLQVRVYVNDSLIGAPQIVAKNGALTSFDRLLGALNVGDTVWVLVDALKNNNNDAFTNFNFSLEKLAYTAQNFVAAAQLSQITVPEPNAAALILALLVIPRRRRR